MFVLKNEANEKETTTKEKYHHDEMRVLRENDTTRLEEALIEENRKKDKVTPFCVCLLVSCFLKKER